MATISVQAGVANGRRKWLAVGRRPMSADGLGVRVTQARRGRRGGGAHGNRLPMCARRPSLREPLAASDENVCARRLPSVSGACRDTFVLLLRAQIVDTRMRMVAP